PPYVPPYIAILGGGGTEGFTNPDEIIASDMPWAVAWYADRESVWIPYHIDDFMDMHDYNRLNGALVGLYLSPITGDARFFSDVVKGEYQEWSSFILRNVDTQNFPFQARTKLPI